MCNGVLTGEFFQYATKKHIRRCLCRCWTMCLKKASMSIEDIDIFAPCIGPGSFTGLRIGIAAAKALCQARGKNYRHIRSRFACAEYCFLGQKLFALLWTHAEATCITRFTKKRRKITSERAVSLEELFERA
ncbi:MAG: hypothetical protein L6V93_11150 [Clostridiales bacterium]|nr:MAG: hypothetical protein L6V93_11150 [Clostridiales bacterium]